MVPFSQTRDNSLVGTTHPGDVDFDRTMPDKPENYVGQLHAALDGRLEGYLRTDEASRALWSTDASIYLRKPVGVVVARSEEDVKLGLSVAREMGLSITPRGTGTSLAGQATAPGLALDVSEMRRALEIDLEGRRCVVEPGLVQGELNAIVEPHGLVFGADTSTSDVATLGGMVGNNSAGMRSLVYGMTSDQILGLRCVLASGETVDLGPLGRDEARRRARHADATARLLRGAMELGDRYRDEIRHRFPRMIRRVSGYGLDALVDPETLDLTRLVCGSEGTLAVVTRAEFRLHPLPEARALASFEFDSLSGAARATGLFLGMDPSAVELLDDVAIGRARANPAYRDSTRFVQGDPKAVLLVRVERNRSGSSTRRFAGLEDLAAEVGARAATPLRTGGDVPDGRAPQVHSCRSCSARRTRRSRSPSWRTRRCRRTGCEEFVGTLRGDRGGERHLGLLLRARQRGMPARPARARHLGPRGRRSGCSRIAEEVADLVVEYGGSISGEHGDGLSRSEFLDRMYGAEIVRPSREVKRPLRPEGMMNPGVIVGPTPMDRAAAHRPRP